ncbi:UNVERIFIED_CONTAM: hypothetical protein NY100_01705 [Prevotella sp. 15_C9]
MHIKKLSQTMREFFVLGQQGKKNHVSIYISRKRITLFINSLTDISVIIFLWTSFLYPGNNEEMKENKQEKLICG